MHTRILVLIAFAGILILFVTKFPFQTIDAGLFPLSLENMTHHAELIIQGKVLGKVESVTTEFYNNSVSVDKIFKGKYIGSIINVLTRPSEFSSEGVESEER